MQGQILWNTEVATVRSGGIEYEMADEKNIETSSKIIFLCR